MQKASVTPNSGEADREQNPGLAPSKNPDNNAALGKNEAEEIELIVMVRAEFLDAPKVARRAGVE